MAGGLEHIGAGMCALVEPCCHVRNSAADAAGETLTSPLRGRVAAFNQIWDRHAGWISITTKILRRFPATIQAQEAQQSNAEIDFATNTGSTKLQAVGSFENASQSFTHFLWDECWHKVEDLAESPWI